MKRLILLASILSLSACGGGGSSTPDPLGGPVTVTGVAATGAPLSGATISIFDATGAELTGAAATVASDGTYTTTIPAGAKAPFVLQADNGTEKWVSVLADVSSPKANITPISHLVATKLSPTGNALSLANEIKSGAASVTATTTTAAAGAVMTALQPLATALNLGSSIDPLKTPFSANGTGFDKMLDSIDVKIEPRGQAAQIEVTVKQALGEDQGALNSLSYTSTATPTPLQPVDANKLLDDGLAVDLQKLLDQLTACYAVPLANRVSGNGTSAADIQADACKKAFFANDPTRYKSGGMLVSKTQHFGGIFTTPDNAGVVFSDPKFFFKVGARAADATSGPDIGDIAFSFRWRDERGNFQIERNMVRRDSDGLLKLIGNQFQYDIGISPYSQRRNFVNAPEKTYLSTGLVFGLSCEQLNQNQSAGNKIVKVNIYPPGYSAASGNRPITMVPNLASNGACNFSYFTLPVGNPTRDGMGDPQTPSTTGFFRIQTRYESGETTPANHPMTLEPYLSFGEGSSALTTDEEISRLPQFGIWKFEYYTATTANSTPHAIQYFRSFARPLTVAGFRTLVKLPQVAASSFASSTCIPNTTYCYVAQASGPFSATWTAPTDPGLVPATYVARIYGRVDRTVSGSSVRSFEDSTRFRSTATSASINCGAGDSITPAHCSGTNFNPKASIDGFDLVGRAPDGSDVSHFYSLRKFNN